MHETPERGFLPYARRNLNPGIRNSFKLSCSLSDKRDFSKWALESDLIWSFGLIIPSALALDGKRTFVDIDDIPSQLLTTRSINSTKCVDRAKLKIQAMIWRNREARLVNMFTGLGVSSEADRIYLGAHPSIYVIPNGFRRPINPPEHHPTSPVKIGFIGTFKYDPNAGGMHWFIKQIWPRIKEQCPRARLRLVGSGSDGEIADPGQGVDGLGYLKDPTEEIASWSMMVVPIFVGGGTRVKIAEGFSRKCPIVSTSLGAYGYDIINGRELYIADTATGFAEACLTLINRPSEAAEMAERAWKKFLEKWTWEAINPTIWTAVEDCLRRQPVP